MHTVRLDINDSVFDKVMFLLKSLPKSEVKLHVENNYDNIVNYPESVVVHTVEEIRKRVNEAEKRIAQGNYVDEEDFWKKIDLHMKQYDH